MRRPGPEPCAHPSIDLHTGQCGRCDRNLIQPGDAMNHAYDMTIDDDTDDNQLDEPIAYALPMTYYWTNAPNGLDDGSVATVAGWRDWRLVAVFDQERFEAVMGPLYVAGNYDYAEADTGEALDLGLPLRAEVEVQS